jgi:cytosine/creatinine deaminase
VDRLPEAEAHEERTEAVTADAPSLDGRHRQLSRLTIASMAEDRDRIGLDRAIAEARMGRDEGGVPIGAALIADDGTVLGIGHNRRVQQGSAIRHGETDALENAGRQPASVYRRSTMYTTLSPCDMCTGAILLYGIPRVVMGENRTFVGGEDYLRARGVEVVNLDSLECVALMNEFIAEHPEIWFEDIGHTMQA